MTTNNSRKHRYRKTSRSNPRKLFTLLGIVVLALSLVILVPTLFNKEPPASVLAIEPATESLPSPLPTALPIEPPADSNQSSAEKPISTPEPFANAEDILAEEDLGSEDHCAPEETSDSGEMTDTVSSATTSAQNASLLTLGDHSSSVSKLQERLTELQYFENEITDYYGPLTESSVRLFQQQNGLEDDGIAGLTTLELLYSEDAKPNRS